MKLLHILLTLAVVRAAVIKESCTGITISGVYHEKEVLKTELDRPYLLAVDYSTNILYFSYSVNVNDDVFKTAHLNLNTKQFKDIEGVNNGFAQTVDQKTHTIYIGGSDGIYKYDYGNDQVDFVGAKDDDIWMIYFKDVLYYSVFPSQFLYTLIDGQVARFKDLEDTKVDHFVIDNENVMYYTNASGLYSQEFGTKEAVLYKEVTSGVRSLTTDINGNVYVCLQDGVYNVNKSSVGLDKVFDVDDAFGLAFDNDNRFVYADASSIIRLKPDKDKAC